MPKHAPHRYGQNQTCFQRVKRRLGQDSHAEDARQSRRIYTTALSKGVADRRGLKLRSGNFTVIFTDLDGTLLDYYTYRSNAAAPALKALAERKIPLIIVTSKTASEVWPILGELGHREPFVVENGGAVIFPSHALPFPVARAQPVRQGWQKIVLGERRARLVRALKRASRLAGVRVRGFSQMSAAEISRLTGLSRAQSMRALKREYDEPFVIRDGDSKSWSRLRAQIRRGGLRATRGSRFFHIHGRNDKGAAVRLLISLFRRAVPQAGAKSGSRILTVGLGDGANDISLLRAVDVAIVVALPGGRYDAEVLAAVPHVRGAGGVGPEGWSRAVLRLLRTGERAPLRGSADRFLRSAALARS